MAKKIKTLSAYRIDVPPEGEFEDYRDKTRIDYQQVKYDERGNVIEEVKFDDFGEMTGRALYAYDASGNLIGEETYDEEGELEEKLSYERDENGRVVRHFIHYLDGGKDTVLYEYNADGKLICKTLKDEDGETERIEKLEYGNGFVTGVEVIEDGETVKQNRYQTDAKGNVTVAEVMDEDEEYRIVNEYDANGNHIRQLKYDDSEKLVEKHEYRYDGQNRMIEVTDENVYGKTVTMITYDEQGNAVKQKEMNGRGGVNHELERDYDEDGNVVEVRAFVAAQGQMPARKYFLIYEYEFF